MQKQHRSEGNTVRDFSYGGGKIVKALRSLKLESTSVKACVQSERVEHVSTSGSHITKLGVRNKLGAQIGWGLLLETMVNLADHGNLLCCVVQSSFLLEGLVGGFFSMTHIA